MAIRSRLLGREADVADVPPQLVDVAHQAGLDLEIARTLDPASLLRARRLPTTASGMEAGG